MAIRTNHAQDLSDRLGKLLRLDVDQPSTEWEMAGYGLRNPWRFSFDRVTGDLWIGDVGQSTLEEIDFVSAPDLGGLYNFGWNVYEGSDALRGQAADPRRHAGRAADRVHARPRLLGHRAATSTAGRSSAGRPGAGTSTATTAPGRIWSLARWEGEVTRRGHPFRVEELTSFGEDSDGELFALSRDGSVYQFVKAR